MHRISRFARACALAGGTLLATQTNAAIVADSVAQFSGVQGQSGWSYGYFAGPFNQSAFTPLPVFVGSEQVWHLDTQPHVSPWTAIRSDKMHPDAPTSGGAVRWAVRRWTSNVAGPINITGKVAKFDPANGDGVTARIIVDNTEIYTQPIAFNDTTGFNFNLNVNVVVGSKIDFCVDPDGPGPVLTDWNDRTTFTAVLDLIPEPASLSALGLLGMIFVRRPR
jgi:hypothetical protein